MTRTLLGCVTLALAMSIAQAQTTLTNGPGPGTISVKVDGYGNFGSCQLDQVNRGELFWTNLANQANIASTCYSGVMLVNSACGGAYGYQMMAMTDTNYGNFGGQAANLPVTVLSPSHIVSTNPATICGFSVTIDQRIDGPNADGSTLVQTYTIQNNTAQTQDVKLVRFVDGDLGGATFANNKTTVSRRLADCGNAAPFESDAQWVMEYDLPTNFPGSIYGISADGRDANGRHVAAAAFRSYCSSGGHPQLDTYSTPVQFNTNLIDGDNAGNLQPGTPCDWAMSQRLDFSIPAASAVTAIFRTRISGMNPANAGPLEQQARDAHCNNRAGNYSGSGAGALLCANGQAGEVSVGAGAAINFGLAAPASGPNPAHHAIYVIAGEPSTGAFCGSPRAADYALWGQPIGNFGLGGFPAASLFGIWAGGGANNGFILASSLPIALPAVPANGSLPCGNTVFTLPGILPDNFSFAAQAIVLDNGAPGAPPVAVSNMINVKVGTCSPAGPCNNRLENGPFTITNTTGTARTIATINFNVPAGGLANPRMISVPSGVVVRTVNAAVGNNIVITFASNTPVQNNGSASFRVCSDNPGISINTVNWQ